LTVVVEDGDNNAEAEGMMKGGSRCRRRYMDELVQVKTGDMMTF
jgi:hypothetical protein